MHKTHTHIQKTCISTVYFLNFIAFCHCSSKVFFFSNVSYWAQSFLPPRSLPDSDTCACINTHEKGDRAAAEQAETCTRCTLKTHEGTRGERGRRLVSGRAAAFTVPPQDLLQQGSPSHCQHMTSLGKLIDNVGRIYPHEDKYFLIPHVKKSKSPQKQCSK